LAPLTDLDLIAIPDAMMLTVSRDEKMVDHEAVKSLQRYMLEHCKKHGGRMAILDALPGQDEAAVTQQRISITAGFSGPIDGALYYPWIKTYDGRPLPPSGHIAGVFARSDARAGVFKAPANEEIKGALDFERLVTNDAVGSLNSQGVNCLRAFAGRGIRVWGARTLSRDQEWRHISVRRLFLTLERWIDLNMTWVNFEPNTPQLWVRITRELSSYLDELWGAGALAGQTADEAFYIKCDSETNSQAAMDDGQTITEIGLAPNAPAEFIVIRIVHHTAVEPR
jgi:phage tail sheath protein FI